MKPVANFGLQSVRTFEDLRRFISSALTNFYQILDNNVLFRDNVKCQVIEGIDLVAGTALRVKHNINVVPKGFIVIKQIGTNVIRSTQISDWTDQEIFIFSDASDTITIIILAG